MKNNIVERVLYRLRQELSPYDSKLLWQLYPSKPPKTNMRIFLEAIADAVALEIEDALESSACQCRSGGENGK